MTSGATYSSVPTSELVLTEGCAASSMCPLCSLRVPSAPPVTLPLPRGDELTEGRSITLGATRPDRRPKRAAAAGAGWGVGEGGVEGIDDAAEAAFTSSGAVCLWLTYDKSKSVSMQCPLRCSRMFSGFRSLQDGRKAGQQRDMQHTKGS